MTTAQSPAWKLKAQADRIAKTLKAIADGKPVIEDRAGKLRAALAKESVTCGVVMDDKILKVIMPWSVVRSTDEAGIAAWILDHMRETNAPKN